MLYAGASNTFRFVLWHLIGGFALACRWAGIETEVFCEKDKRCKEFLKRTYPGIPIVPDIRDFDGTRWRGRFLLTAGIPCQPASRAGKQGGKGDVRWLWPEALRVVSEARPDWCLFENPPGINDVGLGGILADLEALGYEIAPPLIIPACAVNSPQLRARYWIVAHSRQINGDRWPLRQGSGAEIQGGREQAQHTTFRGDQGDMADTEGDLRRTSRNDGPISFDWSNHWSRYLWTPCADGKLRRTPDDSFGLVDGLHRSVLAGLGNSIVPQVAYEVIKSILSADTT